MEIEKLCVTLDRKFKKALPKTQYEAVTEKISKIIGVIYGSVTGLLVGAATQPLGPQSASRAYDEKFPYAIVPEKSALQDPVFGQLFIQLHEFKNAKWDSEKFKVLRSYLSVIINTPSIKVDLYPQFIEQIRTNKPANSYNLFTEDFYTRVPLCALFGDETLKTVIAKIMQTHTSFNASAYGIIASSIIQMILQSEELFDMVPDPTDNMGKKFVSTADWSMIITEKLMPLMAQYRDLYCNMYFNDQDFNTLSESEQKRIAPMKSRVSDAYDDIIQRLKIIADMYKSNFPEIKENTDHMTPEQKNEHRITSIYSYTLDRLNLHEKHSSHPAILAVWVVKTMQELNEKLNLDTIDPSYLIKLILRSVAVRTGCPAYNCMIVGAVLGGIFGFMQLPVEYYENTDPKIVDRINREIWEIIAVM